MELDNEYETIKMINDINLFFSTKNIQNQFTGYDLIKIKKIFSLSSLDSIKNKKEKQRKIKLINFAKNKMKLKHDLNNNKYFLLLIYYYIYKYNKILSCIKLFHSSNLISFHTIFLFLDFFLEINEENKNKKNLYFKNLILVISSFKKIIINIKNEENNNKKIINKDVYNLLEKIFSKFGVQKIENIIFGKNFVKYPKILSLLKLCFDYYSNDILSDDNKNFIINNLKNLYTNHLNIELMNYLYKVAKKYITSNFNNFNNQIKQDKNYYSFSNGILNFLEQIMSNKSPYLLDKYFIFNSNEEKKGILITSPINLKEEYNYNGLNLSFIFSFMVIESNGKNRLNNNKSVILSVNDYKNKEYIFRFILNKNNLYLNVFAKQKNDLLLENIQYNVDYLCFAYYDEDEVLFHFHPKSNNNIIRQKIITKETREIYFELGNISYDNDNDKNMKFNGLIGPVLVFNSKIENPLDIYQKLSKMKKYYLLGDIIINPNPNDNDKIFFSYNEYYGILNNKNELLKIINDLKKVLKNLICYINPEVISNNLNFYNGNKFRDYQIYNDPFKTKNNQSLDKYYEINDIKNVSDFILIKSPFEEFFINNIFGYFVFNIELVYNELLKSNNNKVLENENNIL